ncbi:recombinase family protein [Streptosporangium jomthongense]|uniref:Recombinase family protein n=1 Tax=Streptosporangium jomthongense TaxID=1193683 RepID=A0ABV8F9X4_9ACTN
MTLRQGQATWQHDAHTSAIAGSAPAAARQAAADFLGSETAVLSKALVGYARVSTCAQRLDRQTHALEAAGRIRIFTDRLSGKNTDREELTKALDPLRSGDTLVVPSLDRFARSWPTSSRSSPSRAAFQSLKEALAAPAKEEARRLGGQLARPWCCSATPPPPAPRNWPR